MSSSQSKPGFSVLDLNQTSVKRQGKQITFLIPIAKQKFAHYLADEQSVQRKDKLVFSPRKGKPFFIGLLYISLRYIIVCRILIVN